MIPRYFVVAESTHELQNPTSEEKLVLLGPRLGLTRESRVLDIASGRGGPALVLAREFGCSIHGIEISPEFHAVAVERAARAGLEDRVTFELGNASGVDHASESAVKPGGHVVVGEPYWRRLPLPDDYEDRRDPWTTLEGTVTIFETSGLPVVSVIASSEDDWDRYETLHWQAVERWLTENPCDPDAPEIRARHEREKRVYLRHGRDVLGWAIFVGRKRS